MFVRIKRSVQNGTVYEYLQIVRSQREGTKVRQQVLATLGSRAALSASGELDGLLQSLGRFSENLRVVAAVRGGSLRARASRAWGPALVFGRLWERQGVGAILKDLAAGKDGDDLVAAVCGRDFGGSRRPPCRRHAGSCPPAAGGFTRLHLREYGNCRERGGAETRESASKLRLVDARR